MSLIQVVEKFSTFYGTRIFRTLSQISAIKTILTQLMSSYKLPCFTNMHSNIFFPTGATTHCGFVFCSPLAGL